MLSVLSVFVASAAAHSWVHCTDYRGPKDYYDSTQCFGNVRPIDFGNGDVRVPAQVAFGQDQGFNRNNADGNPNFRPFDGKCQSAVTNQLAGGDFPAATYKRGQRVTLAWPTKNHVAASCTNRFIPDGFVKVFVEPYKNAQNNRYNQEIDGTWRQFPHQNGQIDFRGFQNCPKFCENMDKALCTGDFTVPDLPDGKYSFQWLWKFNPQDEYVTCWEAEISGEEPNNPAANVISTDGCHNNMDEATCMAAVDGRDSFRGEKCAWCCGELCNKDATGGNGGDNRCEPRKFLEEQAGVTKFRNNEIDTCPQPTTSPTPEPSAAPTTEPSAAPTTEPSAAPSEWPTLMPTAQPTEQMMAPDPVDETGASPLSGETTPMQGACVPLGGICMNENMMMSASCCEELSCNAIGSGIYQCQAGKTNVQSPVEDEESSIGSSAVVVAALIMALAICCCGIAVIMWKRNSKDGDMYHKQESWESTDRERYGDRYERGDRRNKRKKKRRSSNKKFTSERRGEASTKSSKETSGNLATAPPTPGSEAEYISDEPTPGDLRRQSTRV